MGKIYDRRTGTFCEDRQFGGKALNFLYGNVAGRIVLRLFVVGKTCSKLYAMMNSTGRSAKKIAPFIQEYGIIMSDFENREYTSFSDFFIRKLAEGRREFSSDKNDLISVADSKLLCYRITDDGRIPIKNSVYTAEEIISERLTEDFYGGYCLVFRLTVDDYHRYCFFDDGRIIRRKYIEGKLHTVSPVSSKRYKVFSENCRDVSYIETENFGTCYQTEIGALLVGRIINHPVNSFLKGAEKGLFEMGGSTCVVMIQKNVVSIDDDILKNSRMGIETKVRIGERIGRKKC